ncbi:MAG: DUF742 domain-containing protein [Labedaea sp.]
MSSADDGFGAGEPTFADVLNGFSLSRHHPHHQHGAADQPAPAPQQTRPPGQHADEPDGENASVVRAYAWTGGRTRSELQLEIETLVSTSSMAEHSLATLRTEHQSVALLCRESKSVAEVGALLTLPLGVVRVLIGDMAGLGLIDVHRSATVRGEAPDLELMQRVLRGLTNLRTAPAHPS